MCFFPVMSFYLKSALTSDSIPEMAAFNLAASFYIPGNTASRLHALIALSLFPYMIFIHSTLLR
jgi:hypothetical protein